MFAAVIGKEVNRKYHLLHNGIPLLPAIIPIYRVNLSTCLEFPDRLHTGEGIQAIISAGHLIFRHSGAEALMFIPKRIRLRRQTAINYSVGVNMEERWMNK